MRKLHISLLLATVILLLAPLARAEPQIIELRHRTAAELLPRVQALLAPHESATEWGQQLIIRADSDTISNLRQLLEQMDQPARRLLITVDNGQNSVSSNSTRSTSQLRGYSSSGQGASLRSIQTVEGAPALIYSGQQISQLHWVLNQHGLPQQQSEQRNLGQGFYVVASIHGDRVTLDLFQQEEHLDGNNNRIIHSQSAKTRLNGRLNQWLEVGAIQQKSQQRGTTIKSHSKNYSTKNNNLRIKVELLD